MIYFNIRQWLVMMSIITLFLLTGCETTSEPVMSAESSGFLKNADQLQPMNGNPATLYYEKQNTNWHKYTRVMIDPVRIQRLEGSARSMSRSDRLKLGMYFEYTMRDFVRQKGYTLALQPAPDVLRVRAAINDVKSADSLFSAFGTNNAGDFGSVSMEGEIVDAVTNERLIAMVDLKAGTQFASFSHWDDVSSVFDQWGEQLGQILQARLGKVTPPTYTVAAPVIATPRVAEAKVKRAAQRARTAEKQERAAVKRAAQKAAMAKAAAVTAKKAQAAAKNNTDVDAQKRAALAAQRSNEASAKAAAAAQAKQAAQAKADAEEAAKLRAEEAAVAAAAAAAMKAEKEAAAQQAAQAAQQAKAQAADPWKGKPGSGSASWSGGSLRPFMLGLATTGDVNNVAKAAKKRLQKNGFTIAGEYSPYRNARIIVVTNNTLKKAAAKSEFGGYGAAIRVGIVKAGGKVQVSASNPIYMQYMYRMKANLSNVAAQLGKAIGHQKIFGSKKGISPGKLKKWRYMFGMPYFDDPVKIASLGGHSGAVNKVAANLKAGKAGVKQVYRIDIPGKQETVFGVAISRGDGADSTVMKAIDTASFKHIAHLPYEILVSKGKVYILNGKFRIASSFPDLTMGQFMGIKNAPGGIEKAVKAAVK